jgi:AraC-like DNA-binding protein/ligand-binding sensor protein
MECESKESSRKKLLNFVEVSTLKEILDAFTTTTGLMANIVDIEGRSIFTRTDNDKCCDFCKIIYSFKGGLRRCQGAYKRAGKQAALFGEPYIFRCPSGLIEWAAPIVVNGEHLGTIICGQVLMWEPEEFFWIELREMNKSLTSDFKDLFQAVKKLPVVSGEKVQAASYMLYVVANYIMKSGWENYNHSQEMAHQQSLLHEEIANRKQLEAQLEENPFIYSLSKETEFISNLKNGHIEEARKQYQSIITDIIIGSRKDMDIIRTRIIELVVLMSRSVMQSNEGFAKTAHTNTKLIKDILATNQLEEMNVLSAHAFDYYVNVLKESKQKASKSNNANVAEMAKYIQSNYKKNLTLDEIAEHVYLSTSYASRVFKKVQGVSIVEYISQVRIEKAKQLLANPHYQIEEIAENVGYADAGYFTKVFRKYEGVTPSKYRQNVLGK